jgi:hypothetical protein
MLLWEATYHLFHKSLDALSFITEDGLCNNSCLPKASQWPHWPCHACKHSTLEFTSPIQGDCTNRGVSCFRVLPRPLIDGGEELSTCAISLCLTYSVWLALPPPAITSFSEWKKTRRRAGVFQVPNWSSEPLRLRYSGRWHRSAELHASRPDDHNLITQIIWILTAKRTSDLI